MVCFYLKANVSKDREFRNFMSIYFISISFPHISSTMCQKFTVVRPKASQLFKKHSFSALVNKTQVTIRDN